MAVSIPFVAIWDMTWSCSVANTPINMEEKLINCLLYTNICTNKYCKFVLNYSDMFRC